MIVLPLPILTQLLAQRLFLRLHAPRYHGQIGRLEISLGGEGLHCVKEGVASRRRARRPGSWLISVIKSARHSASRGKATRPAVVIGVTPSARMIFALHCLRGDERNLRLAAPDGVYQLRARWQNLRPPTQAAFCSARSADHNAAEPRPEVGQSSASISRHPRPESLPSPSRATTTFAVKSFFSPVLFAQSHALHN